MKLRSSSYNQCQHGQQKKARFSASCTEKEETQIPTSEEANTKETVGKKRGNVPDVENIQDMVDRHAQPMMLSAESAKRKDTTLHYAGAKQWEKPWKKKNDNQS